VQYPNPASGAMAVRSDALALFEAHLQQSELARNTVAGYLRDLRCFSRWLAERAGQEVFPDGFSSSDVEAYKQYLSDTLGRSPASINRYLQSVRKFGRFAVMAGLWDSNPAQGVRLLEGSGVAALRALTESAIEQLLKTAEERRSRNAVRDYAMLQLLLQTGVRPSEMVDLRLADLDLDEEGGTMTVCAQGKRLGRRIPLNRATRRALDAHLAQPRPAEASHLFLTREGRPLSIRSVQQVVASLGKAAGLDVSARVLRDTYARSLWQDTRDLHLLTERLGHRRPEAALRYISPPSAEGSSTEVFERPSPSARR